MPLTTPDIDLPIRADATGELAEVEQDSIQDFTTKAEVLLRYRPGMRSDLEDFGSHELLGHIVPLDLSELRQDFTAWIPECNYRITERELDESDPVAPRISVEVDEPSIEE